MFCLLNGTFYYKLHKGYNNNFIFQNNHVRLQENKTRPRLAPTITTICEE